VLLHGRRRQTIGMRFAFDELLSAENSRDLNPAPTLTASSNAECQSRMRAFRSRPQDDVPRLDRASIQAGVDAFTRLRWTL
jgi:hypothetical protein